MNYIEAKRAERCDWNAGKVKRNNLNELQLEPYVRAIILGDSRLETPWHYRGNILPLPRIANRLQRECKQYIKSTQKRKIRGGR